jgi:hypothetical protein
VAPRYYRNNIMSRKKAPPPESSDLVGMAKTIEPESDRAAALIIAAWVDDALTGLLKAYLVQEPKVIKEMFQRMAPLSTFSSRIKAAYLVGLIDKHQYDNLETIRDIRNDFAHSRANLTFQNESIRARCGNLMIRSLAEASGERTKRGGSPPNPRRAFIATALVLSGYYLELREKIEPLGAGQPEVFGGYVQKIAEVMRDLIVSRAKESQS